MSEEIIPSECMYTKEHEWVKKIDSGKYRIGITDFAQKSLGDIVFIELLEVGQEFDKEQTFGVIESVKATSDLFFPCSGTVSKINSNLQDSPEKVNQNPYGDGWLIEITVASETELSSLMDSVKYQDFLNSLDQ